ncbi:hypothetical protein BJY04DRAFT_129979 [Aspergillus karnatakaensis]|uniref:uncharacterized protein n=1 Tax=Aspergillus karnatakaensis TaxID=1810916 RepID=UPI003CCD6CD0
MANSIINWRRKENGSREFPTLSPIIVSFCCLLGGCFVRFSSAFFKKTIPIAAGVRLLLKSRICNEGLQRERRGENGQRADCSKAGNGHKVIRIIGSASCC